MLLKRLCEASGPSGFEGEVRSLILKEIENYADDIKVDVMGNIIVHKKGKGKKVLIDAHMDEVGFIITGFNQDGTLRFSPLGGVNSKIIPSKVVLIGDKKINGVIGVKPIHLQSKEERKKGLGYKDCFIDIGANNRKESESLIELGEYVVFDTKFEEFGQGLISGKAFDDRMGCYVLIEALKENYNCDLYGVFTVQEEIGDRGAYVSAYNIMPDIGIALEGTICADMPSVPKHLSATEIGKGPAVSIMDKTSIFNDDIAQEIIDIANKNRIMYQRRRAIAGGNDAGAIIMSGEGAKVATISVPCRYIHSAISVASLEDIENTKKLLIEYIKTLN
ncbi:M42 family metallopeptidase [Clostridium frigidicarnis]|uniref:Endoglucanase n=1 Tax=Clostridium frigidicarnis TaxID=84698 RepID=A0A1I0Z7U4_9CLOT|nr:M42 family metallopeptidase [Clostridium frigidicarnis]SFB21829.1 endoglucanase [Clostridium frigidicarnis]